MVKFNIRSSKNSEGIMSPRDLVDLYMYGITTKAQDGSVISNSTYMSYILFAQAEIEKHLGVKLKRQIVYESHNYYFSDIYKWTMLQTSYPVERALSLEGWYGQQRHIVIPKEWVSVKLSSDSVYNRSIQVIPNGAGIVNTQPFIYGGLSPFIMFGAADVVPNYWRLKYITGFNTPPHEIYDLVGKLAAINVFNVLGDIILGAGIASSSIGIDGLSQSISTTSSATNAGYGARVIQYLDELRKKLPALKDFYGGIRFTCA